MELALAQNEQMVEAFTADTAQKALADGIRPRCAGWCAEDVAGAGRGDTGECRAELAIVVADEVARALVEGRRLAALLRHPGIGRVPRHADMDHAPRPEREHEERLHGPEA